METVQVELWVLIAENGDYVALDDADSLQERFDEVIGGTQEQSFRRVKVTLTVPKPKAVELVGTVPAEVEGGELRVA
jgi:hypothetical protein